MHSQALTHPTTCCYSPHILSISLSTDFFLLQHGGPRSSLLQTLRFHLPEVPIPWWCSQNTV